MKKRKILVCAVIISCLSLSAYGTIAYFTADAVASNVITSGNIKIDLKETAIPEEGGSPVPFENRIGVMPGTSVSKIVQVENIGSQPAYIRVGVDKEIFLSEENTEEPDLSLVSWDVNSDFWEEKDGFYYYKEVLETGQTSEPLFTEVVFDASMGNMYQNSKAEITVTAQATQVAHNGNNALEAQVWPAERNE